MFTITIHNDYTYSDTGQLVGYATTAQAARMIAGDYAGPVRTRQLDGTERFYVAGCEDYGYVAADKLTAELLAQTMNAGDCTRAHDVWPISGRTIARWIRGHNLTATTVDVSAVTTIPTLAVDADGMASIVGRW